MKETLSSPASFLGDNPFPKNVDNQDILLRFNTNHFSAKWPWKNEGMCTAETKAHIISTTPKAFLFFIFSKKILTLAFLLFSMHPLLLNFLTLFGFFLESLLSLGKSLLSVKTFVWDYFFHQHQLFCKENLVCFSAFGLRVYWKKEILFFVCP